jgi:hypothetical protein
MRNCEGARECKFAAIVAGTSKHREYSVTQSFFHQPPKTQHTRKYATTTKIIGHGETRTRTSRGQRPISPPVVCCQLDVCRPSLVGSEPSAGLSHSFSLPESGCHTIRLHAL